VLPESIIARTLYPPTIILIWGMLALIGYFSAMSYGVPVISIMNFCFSLFPKYLDPSMRSGCVPKYFTKASTYSLVNVFITTPTSIPNTGTLVKSSLP
jgi:hypothetical protein